MLGLFGAVTVVQAIAVTAVTTLLAAISSDEARARPDERDRAVARRGASIAYFVLIVGLITVGVIMPFNTFGWRLSNAALFALVLAETVRHLIIVLSYRRGWHG
jgi:MFS family permease